ncbi:caspase family protein [Maridesulfovibrio frigidus]|uniref:caspase family protein n=1 Tax=Maridesulfovibrio frigidus TaxID=340956 RepID=UPI0004E25343|nr:caspase family protein [Maridesulfovibrio frigidus]
MKKILPFFLLLCVVFCAQFAFAESAACKIADRLAKDARTEFEKDKRKGLALFIKAQEMCPSTFVHNWNLGTAYRFYGEPKQAAVYLGKAVKIAPDNAKAWNALAWVTLDGRTANAKALQYALKAQSFDSDNPAIQDTLLRALIANGKIDKAFSQAVKSSKKWPNDGPLGVRVKDIEKKYLAQLILMAKSKPDEALKGLKLLDDSPKAAEARCLILDKQGKTIEALKLSSKSSKRFGVEYPPINNMFDELMSNYIRARYSQFRRGGTDDKFAAIEDIKVMLERHFPGNVALKKADKDMWTAIKGEAHLPAPPPKRAAVAAAGGDSVDNLLDGLRDGETAVSGSAATLVSDVDENIPEGMDKRPDAVAVIIGNKNYARYGNGIPDVRYAARDAGFMKKYLVTIFGYSPDNIIYITDATRGSLNTVFGSGGRRGKLHNMIKPGKSDVFIYYSGHGAPDMETGKPYLVPVDADVNYIANNGYSMQEFYANMAKLKAAKLTVVMDACFSGGFSEGTLLKGRRLIKPKINKSAMNISSRTVLFASSDAAQVSHWYPDKGHGLYTYFFLKGVAGAADSNKDKKITVNELTSYLKENVPVVARRISNGNQDPVTTVGADSEKVMVRFGKKKWRLFKSTAD